MPRASERKTKLARSRRLSKQSIVFVAVIIIAFVIAGFVIARAKYASPNTNLGACLKLALSSQCDISLELADTDAKRTKGLSDRNGLADRTGMLFDFQSPMPACIWMKDMRFDLDILWLDENSKVIKIENNVSPDTYPKSFCAAETRYVIELGAGMAAASNIKVGDTVSISK